MGDTKKKSLLEQLDSEDEGKVIVDKATPAKAPALLEQLNADDDAPAPAPKPPVDLPVSRKPKSMQKDKDPEAAHADLTYAMDQFQKLTGETVKPSPEVEIPLKEVIASDGRKGEMSRTWQPSGEMDIKAKVTGADGAEATLIQHNMPDGTRTVTKDIRSAETVAKDQLDKARTSVSREIEANQKYIASDIQGITKEMLNNAGLGHVNIPADQEYLRQITSPTGDPGALKNYLSLRNSMLESNYTASKKDIEAKFDSLPFKFDEDKQAYENELAKLEAKHQSDVEDLNNAVVNIASLKIVNNKIQEGKPVSYITPYEVGRELRKVVGDEASVARSERSWADYGEIDPVEKVITEKAGYQALQYAQMHAFSEGDDKTAKQLAETTKDYSKKIIADNPKFRKMQVADAIANEAFKDNSFFKNFITGYTVTPQNIKEYGDKLGIRPEDLEGITPDDVKRRSDFLSEVGSSIIRTGIAPVIEAAGRHIVNPVLNPLLGLDDKDTDRMYSEGWYDNSAVGKMFGGATPDAGGLTGHKNYIETTPMSDNYLMSLTDDKRRNWNVNASTVGTTIADGLGQVLAYVGGGELLAGAGIAGSAASVEHSRRIGLAAFGYITGYDRNKAYANQVITGNTITDEINRISLANARTGVEVLAEQIYTDFKFTDKMFKTRAGMALVDEISKKGIQNIGKQNWVHYFLEAGKETGIETFKEGSEESLTELGNAVWDNMFAPKEYKKNNYVQKAWEAGVIGGVSALLPSGSGSLRQAQSHGPMAQRAMFEVGKAPQFYIDQVNTEAAQGKYSQDVANSKISTINTLANIVRTSVPDQSVLNNKNLTQTDKDKYANNLLQEQVLKAQQKASKDAVHNKLIEKKIKDLQKAREEILSTAGTDDVLNSESNGQSKEETNAPSTEPGGQDGAQGENLNERQDGTPREEVLTNDGSAPGQEQNAGAQAGSSGTNRVINEAATEPLTTSEGKKDEFGFQEEKELSPDLVTIPATNVTNTSANATQESNVQQQEGGEQSSVTEYQGAEGQRNEAAQPAANSSNSDQRSQGEQEGQVQEIEARRAEEIKSKGLDRLFPIDIDETTPEGKQLLQEKSQQEDALKAVNDKYDAEVTKVNQAAPKITLASESTPAPAAERNYQEEVNKVLNGPQRELEMQESEKVGDPVKQRFQEAPKVLGRANTKILSDGSKVEGHFVLTTAEAVTPSHSPDTFGTSEGFPLLEDGRNPNDRDYSIKENKDRVLIRSQNYDGRAAEQVPTVDRNGIVIDGNDRTMSGQLAARQNSDGAYIQAIKDKADVFGFTPAMIDDMVARGEHPRVVFVTSRVMPYNTDTFAAFNPRTTGKVKTAIEEAIQFGRTASDNLLNKVSDVMSRFDTLSDFFKNRQATKAVKDFLTKEGIINPDSVTGFYDNKNQRFTNAGKELLQNLMLGRVFSEESLRLLEYFPGVREKMVFAMNNLIAIEGLGKEYSLHTHLSDALQLKDRVDDFMQENNIPMDDRDKGLQLYMEQGQLFADKNYSPEAIAVWAVMEDKRKTSLRDFTKNYLEVASKYANNSNIDIFGDKNPTRDDIINDYIANQKEYEKYATPRSAETNDNSIPGQGDAGALEQNIQGGGQDVATAAEGDGSLFNDNQENPAVEETPAPAPVDENAPAVTQSNGEPITELPRTTEPGDPFATAVAEHNKYKDFVSKKQRKIELMEEAGDTGSDQYKREQQALKVLKTKLSAAEAALTRMEGKRISNEMRKLKVDNKGLALTTPAQVPVALWNAAIEIAASAVELGANIKAAVQQAVDYVNDRWYTRWDDQALRDALGENATFPMTSEEIRRKRMERAGLSEANRLAADKLVESVDKNGNSLKSALAYIDKLDGVSDTTKNMLKEYVRKRITDDVYKATGQEWGDKHLAIYPDNYKEATESLGLEVDTLLLNATSEEERQNVRQKFAAAKAYLQGRETSERVKNGEIKPVSNIEEPPVNQFTLPKRTAAKIAQEIGQDRLSRLEVAQRSSIAPITEINDAVSALRLYRSKAWTKIAEIREKLGNIEYKKGSFYDRLKQAGIQLDKFGTYLYAKHAQERNAYNAEKRQERFDAKVYELNQQIANSPTPDAARRYQQQLDDILAQKDPKFVLMPDGGSGMTNQQAEEIMKEVEDEGNTATYEAFEKEFRDDVVSKILDFKYDSGLIDDQTYNHLKQFYKNYVPLKVDMEEETGESDGQYFRNKGKNGRDLYRSSGSSERTFHERNNPVLQAMVDLETSIVKAEQNLAHIRLANLVRGNPNENIWSVLPAKYEILKNKYGEVLSAKEVDVPKNAVGFFEAGKKQYVVLNDPGLQMAFKNTGSAFFNKYVAPASRWFTAINTLTNVDFLIRNPFVDQQDAYMTLLGNENPDIVKRFRSYAPSVPKIAFQMFKGNGGEWNDWVDRWKKSGGEITFMEQINLDKHVKKTTELFESYGKTFSASKRVKLLHGLSELATVMEQMTRVMAFRASVEAGETDEKSAVISRNATVDFEKKGAYGAYINGLKAFANAGTQGLANLTYAAVKSPKVRKFLGFMVGMGFLESLVNDLAGDCDEATGENCYWERSEWEKQRNLMLKIPGGEGFVDIPIGRAFGWFNYLGKNAYRAVKTMAMDPAANEGKISMGDFMANTVGSLMGYYNPVGGNSSIEQTVAPTAVEPLVQLSTNKNSFGAPITPENYKGLPEHMNYWPKTGKVFIEGADLLSKATGGGKGEEGLVEVSPEKLSFLYQTAFGGLGKWLYDGAAASVKAAEGEPVEFREVPVARVFHREANMGATKTRAFETADRSEHHPLSPEELEQYKSDLDALLEAGEINEKQVAGRWGFVMNNQKKIFKNRAASRAGE